MREARPVITSTRRLTFFDLLVLSSVAEIILVKLAAPLSRAFGMPGPGSNVVSDKDPLPVGPSRWTKACPAAEVSGPTFT